MPEAPSQPAPAAPGGGGDPISSAVQAGTAIAQTVAAINDMNKRRHFEEALSLLTNRQQEELNKMLLKTNSMTQRLEILSNAMVQYAIANESSVARKDIAIYVIVGVMAVAVFIGAIYLSVKTKK